MEDHAQDLPEERFPTEIADALLQRLEHGEAIVVRRVGDRVQFEEPSEAPPAPIRNDDPELYGYLSSANKKISEATGCAWSFFMFLAAVGVCLALHFYVQDVRSGWWWIYPLVFVAGFFLWAQVNTWREAVVYWRLRPQLNERLASAGYTRFKLIGVALGDPELTQLLDHMKSDVDTDVYR